MNDEVNQTLEAAANKLRAAKLLLESGELGDAASRSYYAVFHAVSALHLASQETYSSHAQVIGKFNEKFVKDGIFPTDFTKIITRLFEDRQTGDYGIAHDLTEAEVFKDVYDAERIVKAIRSYLESDT